MILCRIFPCAGLDRIVVGCDAMDIFKLLLPCGYITIKAYVLHPLTRDSTHVLLQRPKNKPSIGPVYRAQESDVQSLQKLVETQPRFPQLLELRRQTPATTCTSGSGLGCIAGYYMPQLSCLDSNASPGDFYSCLTEAHEAGRRSEVHICDSQRPTKCSADEPIAVCSICMSRIFSCASIALSIRPSLW